MSTRMFGSIRLEAAYRCWRIAAEPHVFVRLKRLFDKINKAEHGVVTLSDTCENARELLWFLERYPMTVEPLEYMRERAEAHREQEQRLLAIVDGNYEPRQFDLALPLRDYQKLCAELALQAKGLLIADDLGLGKSAEMIGVIADPGARPALVVVMTHLQRQWQAEIAKFLPAVRTHILTSGKPYDLTKEKRGRKLVDVGFPDVIISNYHKLSGWADLLAGVVRGCFFDEVQELRHSDSAKFSAAEHIASAASIRCGASGTPIYNFGSELYNVERVLNPGVLGTYEEFRREWCRDGSGEEAGKHVVKDPAALGVYMREQALMLRRTRKDVGRELPGGKPIRIPYRVEADLHPLEEVESTAAELARIILAQGGRKRGEALQASEELSWRLRQATGIAKAPHVATFVRMLVEQGEAVLLGGWHHAVFDIWREKLKDLGVAFFTGHESEKQKHESVQRFLGGDANVLAISLRAGAGIDGLQARCRVVVAGELDWAWAVHEQLEGRPFRDGQDREVLSYFMTTDVGSDPVVADVLGLKRQQLEGIRDPNADPVQRLQTDGGNIRKLAEAYLRQRGLPVPAPAPEADLLSLLTGTEA